MDLSGLSLEGGSDDDESSGEAPSMDFSFSAVVPEGEVRHATIHFEHGRILFYRNNLTMDTSHSNYTITFFNLLQKLLLVLLLFLLRAN